MQGPSLGASAADRTRGTEEIDAGMACLGCGVMPAQPAVSSTPSPASSRNHVKELIEGSRSFRCTFVLSGGHVGLEHGAQGTVCQPSRPVRSSTTVNKH